jgi:hypothetical protein
MEKLAEIADLITDMREDIRAEVVAANLIEAGIEPESIVSLNKGQFKRGYSKDILYSNVIKLNEYKKVLALFLSRDGFYDGLPEGLFHHFVFEPVDSGKEMAHESRKLKKEEEATRKFFWPYEQELFLHRLRLETEERRLLKKISSKQYQEIFERFWKIEPGLPADLVSMLILLLPFAHRITGDYSLTADCLSAILKEEVKFRVRTPKRTFSTENDHRPVSTNQLGKCSLGGDLICGTHYAELCPTLEFIIGPLRHSQVDDYIGSGKRVNFLQCFFSFFVPIGFECSFTIEKPIVFHFTLNEGEQAPVMGYNTIV